MLEQFFHSRSRIRALRAHSDGTLLDGFARALWDAGYAEYTARKRILAASHLLYWARTRGIPSDDLDMRMLARFDDHLKRCKCKGFDHTDRADCLCAARSFLKYRCGDGVDPWRSSSLEAQLPPLLQEFFAWMREQRGTGQSTLNGYRAPLREILKRIGEDPSRLDVPLLRQFILEQSQRMAPGAAKNYATAVRMFLRFLIAQGLCRSGLDAAVPVMAHWRLAPLPRYLQAEEVERVIAACVPSSPIGRRNRAIVLLLARLGLRAGDVVRLRLGDINWKDAWLSVSGKSRRETRLPLSQEVGQAIVDYLQHGRPPTQSDALFLRSVAPFTAFRSAANVGLIVKDAIARAGVACPRGGAAHVLRHSVATSMLRRGASLQDIAALLRHHSVETTQIYAKVDVTALDRIAQPWPEVRPC
jgi:integrase/recombinase XerD